MNINILYIHSIKARMFDFSRIENAIFIGGKNISTRDMLWPRLRQWLTATCVVELLWVCLVDVFDLAWLAN